jgi:hypothetical protein
VTSLSPLIGVIMTGVTMTGVTLTGLWLTWELTLVRLALRRVVVQTRNPSLADVHPRAEHTIEPDGGIDVGIPPPAPPA